MRSAMRCAACVLQSSHDAAPIAATAAMMRSHDASMPVPPSCSRVDTEPGSLSHAYGEREVLSLPRGMIWRNARGPRARYLLLQRGLRRGQVDAAVGPSAVPPVFAHGARGRVFKVWCSEFEILTRFCLRSGATANPSLPAEAPRDALAGLGEAEHPSRPACPPVPSALPQALLPRERMVESRGSADKLMAPIGRHSLTCRSSPASSKARACSRAGSLGRSCSETQT